MEFRRLLHAIILRPVQILRGGREIVYRLLGDNGWLKDFFATWQRLQKLELEEQGSAQANFQITLSGAQCRRLQRKTPLAPRSARKSPCHNSSATNSGGLLAE
jgi:hypothetical protein